MRDILGGASLAMLLAGAAMAQDVPPPGGPQPMEALKRADVPDMVARSFARMDLNHDGVLTDADRDLMREQRRADMVARLKEHRDRDFAAMDANRDGSLSRQEFDNAPPPPPPPGGPEMAGRQPGPDGAPPPPPPGAGPRRGPGMGLGVLGGRRLLEQADANHDGKVTLAEAQKAALEAFDKADVNHDGVLDRDEMMVALRERMGERHRGGPGRDDMRPPRKD